jgi:hypothetical protein
MGRMSDLNIDVRQAERDGCKFFATHVDDGWAVFDVEAAKRSTDGSGIAFVDWEGEPIVFTTQDSAERMANVLNERSA